MFKTTKLKITDIESFSFLSGLNSEELRSLLNDDSKLEEMVKDVEQYKDIEKEKEFFLVSNRSLAEYNLNQEPVLITSKNQLLELNEICEKLYKSVENKYSENISNNLGNNLESQLTLVQNAAQEMEEESESIAESFLSGSNDIDDFLETFLHKRKLMHLRKVKADKMKELLNEKTNSRRVNPAPPPYPTSHPPYPSFNAYRPQPYNLGPVNPY